MSMTIDDSERYLRLMLGGMEYAVRYWKDRDKELSDIEQTIKNHDADRIPEDYWYIDQIREVVREADK